MSTPELVDRDELWPVESSTDLYRDDWVMALRKDTISRPDHPDEGGFDRWVLEHPGAVVVLAMDEQDRVLCLRQYRHAARRRFVELPAGLLDEPGESPEHVAKRELREEAGLEAGHWTYLTSTYSSPGISSEVQHFYLARGLRPVDRDGFEPEHEEADMDAFWVPFHDLLEAVHEGRVTDGPLVVAVLMAHDRGKAAAGRPER
jgi:8-oxo-dGTP pyrophosphatase MutT (NUDIX family)